MDAVISREEFFQMFECCVYYHFKPCVSNRVKFSSCLLSGILDNEVC